MAGGGEGDVSQGLAESTHFVSSKGSYEKTEAPPTKVSLGLHTTVNKVPLN